MYFVSHKSQIIFLRKERIYLNLANVLPIIYMHAEFQNVCQELAKMQTKYCLLYEVKICFFVNNLYYPFMETLGMFLTRITYFQVFVGFFFFWSMFISRLILHIEATRPLHLMSSEPGEVMVDIMTKRTRRRNFFFGATHYKERVFVLDTHTLRYFSGTLKVCVDLSSLALPDDMRIEDEGLQLLFSHRKLSP